MDDSILNIHVDNEVEIVTSKEYDGTIASASASISLSKETANDQLGNKSVDEIVLDKCGDDDASEKVSIIKEKYFYDDEMDQGPFRVIVETKNKEKINKLTIGFLLKKFNKNTGLMDIKKTGKNKVTVYFNRANEANVLLNSKEFNKEYDIYLPIFFISVKGVIAGVPMDIDIDEIKEEIDVNMDVLAAYRMTRFVNGSKVPTDKVAITFRTRTLPKYIRIYNLRSRVDPFISKTVICPTCLRYNHKKCKNEKKRCKICSGFECNDNCDKKEYCFLCKAEHKPNSKDCKELEKQKKIKKVMKNRAISYHEARDELNYFLSNKFSLLEEEEAEEEPNVFELFAESNYKAWNKNKVKHKMQKNQKMSDMSNKNSAEDKKRKRDLDEELPNLPAKQHKTFEGRNTPINPHRTSEAEKTKNEATKNEIETKYQNFIYQVYKQLINKQNLNEILTKIEDQFNYELINKNQNNENI